MDGPIFTPCLYCRIKCYTDIDTGKLVQITLFEVHGGGLWCCEACVSKYSLETIGCNKIDL